jgi:hypothetical protein
MDLWREKIEAAKLRLAPVISFIQRFWSALLPRVKPFTNYFLSFWRTLAATSKVPDSFWALDIEDAKCFSAMLGSTFAVWLGVLITGPFASVLCYWDGPNYVYAAITFYDVPHDNPWMQVFHYAPSYFACHLPGFPLLIRFWGFFTVGNYYLADVLAIFTSTLLMSYSFRRLLVTYRCVANPTYTTVLLAFVPMRLVIYHSVGASEPLFIAEVCFALLFYKLGNFTGTLLSVWAACITRIEGMEVGFVLGLCSLLRLDIFAAAGMFLTFIAPVAVMALHQGMFGDALAYIHFNRDRQGLVGWPPFPGLVRGGAASHNALDLHSFLDFYPLYVIGALLIIPVAGPLGIFAAVHLAYVSLLRHADLFRYALPAAIFALLVGLDRLWTHRVGFSAVLLVAPFYVIEMMAYAAGQIHSNRCWDTFLGSVFDAAKDHLH